ncbi:hypothetical protein [Streptomyces sp. CT34]|uniref:hypothetical protein n=1 Tax=Streptomyces sp. CT34 TaxID=1553907 RepID=UPI0005BB2E92|nr:hypothetical protein [Streptomyces sp. CT34]
MIDTASLFTAAHLTLIPAALLLVVKVVHLLAARRAWFSRHKPWRGVELTVLSASAGLWAYVPGLWIGFDMDGSTAPCLRALDFSMRDEAPGGDLRVVERMLPLSRECRWDDGTHLELVPVWLNVVILAALAGVILGITLTVYNLLRHRYGTATNTTEKTSS